MNSSSNMTHINESQREWFIVHIMDNKNYFIEPRQLGIFIEHLQSLGYQTIGPVVRDKAIVYDEIEQLEDLPCGITDEHAPGHYQLKARDDKAYFGYVVGPQSWKKFLFPARQTLFSASKTEQGFSITTPESDNTPYAFIGVRGCELQAIQTHDKVFTQKGFVDSGYQQRREKAFVVALNCGVVGANCFCTSMNTGPKVEAGYDLSLTELLEGTHGFVVNVQSQRAQDIAKSLQWTEANAAQIEQAQNVSAKAAQSIQKKLDTKGLPALLQKHAESSHWESVADRCLSCANCTLVCPTCFCSTTEELTSLDGQETSRERRWDSCFNESFTYVAGGHIRISTASRYRQWMTHKLSYWHEQFGESGCTGCGRCITWCPTGIDITAEAAAIRQLDETSETS